MDTSPEYDDAYWLEAAGREGWVVLTADAAQRRNPIEAEATKRFKVRKFTLTAKNCTGDMMRDIIAKSLLKIERLLAVHEPPFDAKITKRGEVEIYPE